jgi:hypothetical protein
VALRYTSCVIACQPKTARREKSRHRQQGLGAVRAASPGGTMAKRLRLRIGTSSCKDGRFLQVDPVIKNPANSQSLNAYSYVGNNPLSGTDPTGYQDSSCTVSAGTFCTANLHDDRSADRFSNSIHDLDGQ